MAQRALDNLAQDRDK